MLIAFSELALQDRGWPRLTVQSLLALLLASVVIREDHWARPILALPFMARLGVISYGMYVYHSWVMGITLPLCNRLGMSNAYVWFVLVTAGTYLVAEVSFRLVEEPLLRLKSKYGH